MKKWLPLIVTGLIAAWYLSTLRAPADKNFAYREFGRLPILFNGRLQPMDSLARNSLLQLREKQTANLEPWKDWNQKPRIIPAVEWLATVMMDPDVADTWPVFRVDNPELIALLGLPGKDKLQHQDGKHYSWNQIQPALQKLDAENQRIDGIDPAHRDAYERAVVKMQERLVIYVRLKDALQPEDSQNWQQELAEYERLLPTGVAAVKAQQAGQTFDETVLGRFGAFAQRFNAMLRFDPPLLVPPRQPKTAADRDKWQRTGEALLAGMRDGKVDSSVHAYAAMATAFKAGDAAAFNRQLADYRSSLATAFSTELGRARWEVLFNQMQPFYNAMVIYVLAFALACAFWFNLADWLRRTAVWLIGLALVIHTAGLAFRVILQGYPPVTNLYSSAIFIGWVAVVVGLVLERFFRNSIGAVAASAIGFITALIAHHLGMAGGDTMEMMRAVLDNNFWLTTHVLTVTAGYASTFFAGVLAIIYVVLGLFTTRLSTVLSPDKATGPGVAVGAGGSGVAARRVAQQGSDTGRTLARMIYGIVCFATLFSFVGTVLGGIWADQSWGRFWGWDPKENGALIIVLWNALILHLRWGGVIRERGLVTCAIVGNIVTSWSWFGVNMLGIGLHSYGFMDAAFWWLMLFVASQVGLIILGSLPLSLWRSFRRSSTPPKPGGGAGTPAAAVT